MTGPMLLLRDLAVGHPAATALLVALVHALGLASAVHALVYCRTSTGAMAWVGSSNVDNRSMRLNFEGNAVVLGQDFAEKVERMLQGDFEASRPVGPNEYNSKSPLFKIGVNLVRLVSPIL